MNTFGEYTFDIRSYECGPDGAAKLASVMNYLQEAASLQAEESGFSKSNFDDAGENISWVLTRFSLKLARAPRWHERLAIGTWPCGGRKIVAYRDFELRVGGERIGAATSEWMLIDLATRKIVPVPQSVYALSNDERARALPDHVFPKLHGCGRAAAPDAPRFRARRGDIDLNGHVNNVHYVEWLVEALPAGAGPVEAFEIAFKSETLAGDEVVAEVAEVAPRTWAGRVASADGRDHVVASLVLRDGPPAPTGRR